MLPSMPILFTRDSQDAFGNKIEPSTSFFSQNLFQKPISRPVFQPPPPVMVQGPVRVTVKETKAKSSTKKKDQEKEVPPKIDNNALETALVRSYFTKVQSRFSSHTNLPNNKFIQFHNMLKTFDPSKESPVDLYKRIEQLFGDQHKDIVEEFLLFMKPGQAAQVGRFMDRFKLVQITGFIKLLQTSFVRKPTVLRKILRALTTGINSGNSDEMKTRVLPHLRSNPRLTQTFKSLFPDERPPDSLYETGTDILNEEFLTADKGYDVWEFEDTNDNMKKLETKEKLDTMYLHGRVFLQHGRMLRSARVTYPYSKEPYRVHVRRLAPNHCHLSPPESDEERASPKRQSKTTAKIPPKRTRKLLKSPTKSMKDVNDNTNKDMVNSPKIAKKQTAKSKTLKKDESKADNVQKKDRKERNDNKNHVTCKKDDSKVKQDKTEAIPSVEETNIVEEKTIVEDKYTGLELKSNWTRDEDKTILQVLKGQAGSEQIFGKINELLPHRSPSEIKERFCHVMNLLHQMAVGEVT